MTSFQHLTVFMNIQQVKLKLTLNKNIRYRDFYFIIFHHFNSSLLGFCKINSINFAFKVKHIMMAIFSSVIAFFQIFLQYRCPWFQCSSTLSTYMNMFCWLYLSKKQLFFAYIPTHVYAAILKSSENNDRFPNWGNFLH